jgi:AraC-like DNA-binding protein
MNYDEWVPASATHDDVVCCWSLRSDVAAPDAGAGEPALPDGSPELLFNLADRFEYLDRSGVSHTQPDLFLVGQITGPFTVRPTGAVDLIAVRFEAHGAFGLVADLAPLRDGWASAEALSDRSLPALRIALLAHDDAGRRELLEAWIAGYARRTSRADDAVAQVVRVIRRSGGAVPIETAAAQHGIAIRTLQRRFATQVGVSPKQFARIVRFHRVCSAWRHAPETMARVAASCGYSDESHLIRDFRAFVGEPPAAFLASLPDFTTHFLSSDSYRRTGHR